MRKLATLVALLMQLHAAHAQKHRPFHFDSYNSVGLLAGKSPVAFTAQTVNGIRINKWFFGAGFGIDNYNLKTLPLFASARRDFNTKAVKFFLYADAGTHFMQHPHNRKEGLYYLKTSGKMYLEGGAGIKIATGKNTNLFFTAGNSYKQIKRVEEYPDSYRNEVNMQLGRISFRAGFKF